MERLTHYNKEEKYYDVKKAYLCDIDEYDGETYINTYNVYQKLGQLEDLEEELGIDLITLFKVLKDGVYYIYNADKKYIEFTNNVSLKHDKDEWFIHVGWFDMGCPIKLYLKDYGKTWALTRKELEK